MITCYIASLDGDLAFSDKDIQKFIRSFLLKSMEIPLVSTVERLDILGNDSYKNIVDILSTVPEDKIKFYSREIKNQLEYYDTFDTLAEYFDQAKGYNLKWAFQQVVDVFCSTLQETDSPLLNRVKLIEHLQGTQSIIPEGYVKITYPQWEKEDKTYRRNKNHYEFENTSKICVHKATNKGASVNVFDRVAEEVILENLMECFFLTKRMDVEREEYAAEVIKELVSLNQKYFEERADDFSPLFDLNLELEVEADKK